MKLLLLFLLFFLCIGCTSETQKRGNKLDKELATTPLLTASFDSLLQDVRKLPNAQQVKILFRAACQEQEEIRELEKQEELLLEIVPIASKKKKMLLQLSDLYIKMDRWGVSDADIKGIKRCEELEKNYSLSQKERWKVKETKALLLNRRGKQKQYLPIWYELLAEHRAVNEPKLIIEDLRTIANHFTQLGDWEKGIYLYQEAHQLAIDNQLSELQDKCLLALVNTSCDAKKYQKTISYIHQYRIDSVSSLTFPIYSILATCYFELHKPDSARIYLSKMNRISKKGNGVLLHCRIAETYLSESQEDSTVYYLDKAMSLFKEQAKQFQDKNLKVLLPLSFLSPYSSYATLLHQNGKTQQADEAFKLVEPLMIESTREPTRMETQIKGLTLFSAFCRSTKKYEKALDLLARRDSLQDIRNRYNEARNSKNLADYRESETIIANTKINIAQARQDKQILIWITWAGLLFAFLTGFFLLLYLKLRKKFIANNKRIEELMPKPLKKLDPIEKRFRAVEKEVAERKLYLNKKLSLTLLQEELKINRGDLSKCINTHSGGNFNQWINGLRIHFVLEQMQHTSDIDLLIKKSGFSSSNFYVCFKEMTGYTPKEYLDLRLFEQNLSLQQLLAHSLRNKKKSGNLSIRKITALYSTRT